MAGDPDSLILEHLRVIRGSVERMEHDIQEAIGGRQADGGK